MTTWALIIVLGYHPAPAIVPGFSSAASCERAAQELQLANKDHSLFGSYLIHTRCVAVE